MKKIINYIQNHKDDAVIFTLANELFKEGKVNNQDVVLEVIIYLNTLVKTKESILNASKVA